MHIDYGQIGQRIKAVRKSKNLTQERMAELLDVSVGYVSQVERGVTKISLDLLAAIATILNCDIAVLLNGSTVATENYLADEFSGCIKQLTPENRKLVLKIIGCILEQQS